jgi:hypothetical protein
MQTQGAHNPFLDGAVAIDSKEQRIFMQVTFLTKAFTVCL